MKQNVVKVAALLWVGVLVASPSFAGQKGQPGAATDASVQPSTTPPAVSLKDSLTAEQQQALTALADRFEAKLTEIAKTLEAASGPSARDKSRSPASLSGAALQSDAAKAAFDQLKSVQAQIDSEAASILSRAQFALHKQATSAIGTSDLAKVTANASASSNQSPVLAENASGDDVSTSYVGSTCVAGAQYASWARYWAYYASYYGYLNYVSYGHANSYASWANTYLSYAESYAKSAVQELSAAYFNHTQLGADFDGFGSSGSSDAYNAQYYAYYGYYYAYYDWANTGRTYAYYAQLYGYNAYTNALSAYNSGSYCH